MDVVASTSKDEATLSIAFERVIEVIEAESYSKFASCVHPQATKLTRPSLMT